MSLLDPLSHALAALVAAAHAGLTLVGADPAAGTTWLLCIAAVVVAVRVVMLPLVAHGVRLAHASARARPHLQDLTERYRNRTDRESLRRLMEERRRIAAEHGMPRLGCLPILLQLPIWLALYHLLAAVAAGSPVGAMGPELVASLGAATLLGVPLAERGYLGAGAAHLAVVAGMAVVAAALTYARAEVLRRAQHRDRRPARGDGQRAADDARAVGSGPARRRRCGAGGAARLLGVQLAVDAGAVGGHLAVVPHARIACGQPAGLRPERVTIRSAGPASHRSHPGAAVAARPLRGRGRVRVPRGGR